MTIDLKKLLENDYSVTSKNRTVYIASVGGMIKRYEVSGKGFNEIFKDLDDAIEKFLKLSRLENN